MNKSLVQEELASRPIDQAVWRVPYPVYQVLMFSSIGGYFIKLIHQFIRSQYVLMYGDYSSFCEMF